MSKSASLSDMVGARILAVRFDGELVVLTDRGIYRGIPTGDCCANCYVQHIEGSWALEGGAVISEVENIELPPIPDGGAHDVSEVWGHRVHTDKGICTIEMRVDHNGYYSGWLNVRLEEIPDNLHEDCLKHPDLMKACGCFGPQLEDF